MPIYPTCFNMLIFIGKTKNLISLMDLILQDKEYQQNGVLKKTLDTMHMILKCSNLGMDLV